MSAAQAAAAETSQQQATVKFHYKVKFDAGAWVIERSIIETSVVDTRPNREEAIKLARNYASATDCSFEVESA